MSDLTDATEYKSNKVYPWLVVATMFIVCFASIGYTMASIGVYLPAQLGELIPAGMANGSITDPNSFPAAFTLWITLYGFGMAFVLLFTGKLWQKIDARILVTVGFAGQMIAVTMMSQYHELWQFYLSGVCIGLFGGLYYMIGGPFLANNWFAKKTGVALGIINAGTGAGGLLNPLIIQFFIDQTGSATGWRTVQMTYGIVLLIVVIPLAIIFLRSRPASKGMKPYGWTPEYEAEMASKGTASEKLPGVSFKNAIKSFAFWLLAICAVCACFFGGYNNFYPTFVIDWGFTPMFGALLVSLAGICNFFGPITGGISDKIGAKKTTIIIIALIGIGWLGWYFCGPSTPSALIIVFMFLTSVQMVVVGVQLPLCAREVFGSKDYEKIWSSMMIGVGALSSFAAPLIALPYASSGNYYGSFLMGVAVAVIAIVTLIGMYASGKKLKWED